MGFILIDRTTGHPTAYAKWGHRDFDEERFLEIQVREKPANFHRLKRWDGRDGLRDATTQEIAGYDNARGNKEADSEIDSRALKSLAEALKLQFPALDLQQLKSDFRERWKENG